MNESLLLLSMLILIGVDIYNILQIKPKWIIPKGYWKEHPGALAVILFSAVLLILSFIT